MNLLTLQVIYSLVCVQQYYFQCSPFQVLLLDEAYFFDLLDLSKYYLLIFKVADTLS